MRGFLLDSHIPKAVVPSLGRLRTCRIVHLSQWRGGALRNSPDSTILLESANEGLVMVSYDLNTMPYIVGDLIASGAQLAGVAFVPSARFAEDVGALARALADLLDHPERIDPSYPVVYLRPLPIERDEIDIV